MSMYSAAVLVGNIGNVERGGTYVQAACRFTTEGLSGIVIGEVGREVCHVTKMAECKSRDRKVKVHG